jgi:hypothetical protein
MIILMFGAETLNQGAISNADPHHDPSRGAQRVRPACEIGEPDQWITIAARVHGGFGPFVPVGIRIGLDALQQLRVNPVQMCWSNVAPSCNVIVTSVVPT